MEFFPVYDIVDEQAVTTAAGRHTPHYINVDSEPSSESDEHS